MNNSDYVKAIKKIFIPGYRIKLISMNDPDGLPSGSKGYVDFIDDAGQIHMNWDNGSSLALIYNVDEFEIIPDECGTKYVIKGIFKGQEVYFNIFENQSIWGSEWNVRKLSETFEGATLYESMEEAESICESIGNEGFKVYPVCPRCHHDYFTHPAISRFDNKTLICEKCGLTEGLIKFFEYEKKATQ